jgi:hypothetical protein
MHRVTLVAHQGHFAVVWGVVKGRFLVGVLAAVGVALQAGAITEGIAQMGGLLKGTHRIGHCVTRRQGLDNEFIGNRRANVAVDTLDVFVAVEVMCRCQGKALPLHRMKLAEFLLVQMAGGTEGVVLLQAVRHHHTATKRPGPKQQHTRQQEGQPTPGYPHPTPPGGQCALLHADPHHV